MSDNLKINPADAKMYAMSYNTLRISVGVLGIVLPFLLVIGTTILNMKFELLNSISSYAHSRMGNGFVGIMCAVSLFMFSYPGYEKKDNILGNLAGLFALGIAFFPNNVSNPSTIINIIHLVSALLFFTTLILFSLWLFPKTNQKIISKEKKNRNKVYKVCGYIMILCIALIIVYKAFLSNIFPTKDLFQPTFWLESAALFAFGISWITKGEVIYRDKTTTDN